MRRCFKDAKIGKDFFYHHAQFDEAGISRAREAKRFDALCLFLSVTLLSFEQQRLC